MKDQLDHGQALAVQTSINQVGWAFNKYLHHGEVMSFLVLHLLANEGAQFVGNQKQLAIAGGLVLVEKSKIPKFLDGKLSETKMATVEDDEIGKSNIFFMPDFLELCNLWLIVNLSSNNLGSFWQRMR